MISKATLRYLRMTPRKFRLIIPLVKGKNAEQAVGILMNTKKLAAKYAIDLINSALANAKRKQAGIDVSTLCISNLVANHGPMLKRYRAASMGRASPIQKHTSHVTVELSEAKKQDVQKPETRVQKPGIREQSTEHRVQPALASAKGGPGRTEKKAAAKKEKTTHKEPHRYGVHKKGKE
jgi:large subunit ribosomal protein L22